jgi:hypothetical protein
MPFVTRLRHAVWIACACVLLCAPIAAAADRSLAADFDGDGKSDRVAIDHTEPSLLHVWLSTTGRTDVIRNARTLFRIAATDLDGDDRPELIATDASPEHLRVWKKDGARRAFLAYAPRRAPARALPSTHDKTIDDYSDNDAEVVGVWVCVDQALSARATVDTCRTTRFIHAAPSDDAVAQYAWSRPSAPRAPPASPA